MTESTISQISKIISENTNTLVPREEKLNEIAFVIDNIKRMLDKEKVRQALIINELHLNKSIELKCHLSQINTNIEKLQVFMDILNKKKNAFSLDIKTLISTPSCIQLSKL